VQVLGAQKTGHGQNLGILAVAHRLNHRFCRIESGQPRVEAHDLSESPRSGVQGRLWTQTLGGAQCERFLQFGVLGGEAAVTTLRARKMRGCLVEAPLRLTPENMPLEQDLRPAVDAESATLRHAGGFDVDHGPDHGRFCGLQPKVPERQAEPG